MLVPRKSDIRWIENLLSKMNKEVAMWGAPGPGFSLKIEQNKKTVTVVEKLQDSDALEITKTIFTILGFEWINDA